MIRKGRNSVRNKITPNKGDIRDDVYLKPLNGFERITLRDNHDKQNTYATLNFSTFFTVNYCDPATLSDT